MKEKAICLFILLNLMEMNDIVEVAEKLYYEANPTTKKDIPSFVYEQIEKADKRRFEARSELNLYDWCKLELITNKK